MSKQINEKGFVLATSLVMLLLMSMLTAAVFISVDASQKSSRAAQFSTQSFYYAETAINYMKWSLDNNVEFDSYTYPNIVRNDIPDTDPGAYSFGEPDNRGYDPAVAHPVTGDFTNDPYVYLPDTLVTGDFDEWRANRFNPSGEDTVLKPDGTNVQNAGGVDVYGQLMYYDNSPLASRIVSYQSDDIYSNGVLGQPELFGIHASLPRYIMLSIDEYGQITPSMPPVNAAVPWHNSIQGVDYPTNGALVWVTGGNRTDDLEIAPMDTFFAPAYNNRVAPAVWDDELANPVYTGLACTLRTLPVADPATDMQNASAACLTSGAWVDDANYGLVIYALGYVRGKAQRLVRVVYE